MGIVFGLAIFGIVYIIIWSVQNDNVKDLREQKGLLRMKVPQLQRGSDQ